MYVCMYVCMRTLIVYVTYPFIIFGQSCLQENDVGRQSLEVYPCIKFRLPQCFSLSVTHTYISLHIGRGLFFLFSKKYII